MSEARPTSPDATGSGHALEVRHLQVIDALQRRGSVTEAAALLGLSQPAVSHALQEIQRRLGVPVTRREGRGVRLTSAGEVLARRARGLLDDLRRAELEAVGTASAGATTLRVSTQCYTCFHWLPKALAELRTRLPDLRLELVTDVVDDTVQAVLDDRVDLAIVHNARKHQRLDMTPLFQDELLAIVAPGDPLAELPYLEAEHFAGRELLFHFDPEHSALMTDVLGPAGIEPAHVSQLRLTEAVVESVKAGLGVAIMARWAVEPHLRDGSLAGVRVTPEGLCRQWWACFRHGNAAPGIRELAEILRHTGLR